MFPSVGPLGSHEKFILCPEVEFHTHAQLCLDVYGKYPKQKPFKSEVTLQTEYEGQGRYFLSLELQYYPSDFPFKTNVSIFSHFDILDKTRHFITIDYIEIYVLQEDKHQDI